VTAPPSRRKLSFKEQRELEGLPARIEALEAEQARLEAEVSSPHFYQKPAAEMHAVLARLEALPAELEASLRRWDELDSSHR
jgi:ATP-binding cassette subfamily F protein uup